MTELMPLIEQADAIAAVLPLQMQANLLKVAEGKPVLQAVAERVLSETERTLEDGRKEREVQFIHKRWEQLLRIEVQTRVL